jgi:DnaJ-class molecular chaperone
MPSDLLNELLKPRTWRVRCPSCLGRPTRTEGAWSATESPRVVWTCPTCKGDGEVDVQLGKGGIDAH